MMPFIVILYKIIIFIDNMTLFWYFIFMFAYVNEKSKLTER